MVSSTLHHENPYLRKTCVHERQVETRVETRTPGAKRDTARGTLSGFVDERVSVIPGVCRPRTGERPLLCLRYRARASRGIPGKEAAVLGGEMEHEAREARPIGAQGAFASNSMHYTYPRPLSILPRPTRPRDAPSIPPYIRHRLTEKRFSKRTSIRFPSAPNFFRRRARFHPTRI